MGSEGKRTAHLHRVARPRREDAGERERAEARQVRARLEHLIAASPAVIYTVPVGRAFGATFISPNVTAVLGYEPGEFTRDPAFWTDRIHPEDLERIFPAVRERITRGTSYSWDYRFRAKDGTYRWMHDEGRLTTDDRGAPEFAGYWVDVTERKEAQETLRESRDRLEAILNASLPDLFFEVDGKGRILDYRAGNEDLLYVPPGAFLGKTFADVLPHEVAEVISEGLTRARTLGKTASASYALDLPAGRRWFDLSIRPIGAPDPQGHLVCLVRDITERRRAEDALREASALNQQIIESAQEGIVVYDRDLRYVTWNPFMERLSGIPARDVLGRRAADLFPLLREQGVIERVARALEGETPAPVDVIHKRADGRWGWATDTASPLRDSEGRVVGAISIVQDISERKRSEQEILRLNETLEGRVAERTARLTESEAWLRAILTSLPDAVVTVEEDGTVASFNPAAERAFGYTAAEVIGRDVSLLLPAPDRDERDGQLDRYRRAGEAHLFGDVGEVEGRRKDGAAFPIEIWVAEVKLEGRRAFVAALRDITERKRAVESLRASETRYRLLFDRNLAGVYRSTIDGEIIECNDAFARIYGYPSRSDMEGHNARELYPSPGARDAFIASLKQAGELVNSEFEGRRRDGTAIWTLESVSLVEPESRGVLEGTVIDVTQRRRAEEALRESEKRFRSLAEAAFEGIAITDQGRVVDANRQAADMLGYTVAEMIGRPAADFIADDWVAIVEERMQSGWGGLYEHVLRRKDGSTFPAEAHARAFPFHGRQLRVTALRDITERKRAEEEQARLSRAVAQATESIVITDPEGTIVYVNPAFERITGYTRAEAVGQNPRIIRSGRHSAEFYRAMWDTLARGGVWSGRLVNRRKDGTLFEEDATIGPVLDASGRLVNYVGVKRDVSGEAALQQQLRGSEERFRRVVEHIQDALVIDDVDGRIVFANQHFADLLGYDLERARQLTLEDYVAPEWRAPLRARHDQRVRGEPAERQFEFEALRADGRRVWIEVSVVTVVDPSGVIMGTQSALRDVGERKRDQEALRAAANEWQRSFDSVDVALVLVDVDGRILRLNRRTQALSGRAYSELLGTDVRDLEPTGLWREAAELALHPADDGALRPTRITDGGTGRTWEIRVSEVPHPDPQRPRRLIVAATEVTEAARMEEALRRSETMAALGSLASGVAHEVRGPLFALSANLDALEASVDGPLATRLKPLRRSAARLNVLMEDLLDFTRPNTIRLAKGSFAGPIQEAREDCLSLADREGVLILSDPDPADKPVFMDRDRLRQVFTNLLQNAIHHSARDNTVRIEFETFVDSGRQWVSCLVSDQGPGFREEDLQRAFEPFFTRRKGGTGLGLAIAKRVVLDHHGRIEARNLPAGGACVIVTLPLADA